MAAASSRHLVSLIACARWETACITEWLLYHRAIGFDHVYLYCNDDDPAELYGEVLPFIEGDAPFVTFAHFPFQGQQFQMYAHCLRAHAASSEWVMFLDVDEFLSLRDRTTIKAFLDGVPSAWDSVSFNWVMFGHAGHRQRPPGSVLLNYVRREDALKHVCKTLTRTAAIDLGQFRQTAYVWHHWDERLFPDIRACNVLGQSMTAVRGGDEGRAYAADPENARRVMQRAVVHHYAFKSEQDYVMRTERGSGGDFISQARYRQVYEEGRAAESLRPWNAVEDTTLSDYWRRHLDRAQATRIIPVAPWPNLALGKPAEQSSISEWSIGATTAQDAGNAVNGRITGGAQFHTAEEAFPWWSVDLLAASRIHEIRIYNRVDSADAAARLKYFFIEGSPDGEMWTMIHAKHDESLVGGADGRPLIVRFEPPERAQFVKITLVDPGFLHLDQVEIYGETDAGAQAGFGAREAGAGAPDGPFPEAAAPMTRAPAAAPVIHVNPNGRLANQMLQFMAAYSLASHVPGALLSGVDLPEWGISHPAVPAGDGAVARIAASAMRLDIADLAVRLRAGEIARVELDSFAAHLHNYLPRQVYGPIFASPEEEAAGFGADRLVINIRGGEILQAPHADYTQLPVEFYQEIVGQTRLAPVFMGQIGANPYVQRLRQAFPGAMFLPSQGPLADFQTIRRSRNVVLSVSTFSWLAAWLSDADRIFMPMTGFFNPAQFPEIDLLPLADPRYRFYLFPVNYAVKVEDIEAAHRSLRGTWRYMRPEMIEELRGRRPRFGSPVKLLHEAFDEAFYLERNDGVRQVVEGGGFRSGFEHYVMYGYFERRDPFALDKVWYGRQYPLAAIEVGQGDFADFHHHYLAVGRERGYQPLPPPAGTPSWDERVGRRAAESENG